MSMPSCNKFIQCDCVCCSAGYCHCVKKNPNFLPSNYSNNNHSNYNQSQILKHVQYAFKDKNHKFHRI